MSFIAQPNKEPYVSCIKINGVPILPPLITNEERQSLLKHKIEAIAIEEKLEKYNVKQKTTSNFSLNLKYMDAGANTLKTLTSQGIKNRSPCRSPRCHKIKRLKNSVPSRKCDDSEVTVQELSTPRRCTIRRNSYTLESPTPEILEQLCALQYTDNRRLNQEETVNDLLKIERNKCLKHLNKMNSSSKESHGNINQIAQEKLFIGNLPENFFKLNNKVLYASRNQKELCENKLSESIHLATTLLNSINSSTDNAKHNSTKSDTMSCNNIEYPTDPCRNIIESSLTDSADITLTLHSDMIPCESKTRSENLLTPIAVSTSTQPYHRHRRSWNLKQAKRLWENEEIKFPTRECHSEPASRGHTPPLLFNHSYSLDCLLDTEDTPILAEDLETPTYCLESSLDTLVTSEDPINLYSYYLNLFKDMSEYVSQQGELLNPGDCQVASDDEKSQRFPDQLTTIPLTSDVENISTSGLANYNPVQGSFDLIQFSNTSDESLSTIEIPDNVDNLKDIEKFLLELQHSQEREMELLLRKQKEEQLWLKQRQEKLKESVLSISRGSSVMSSLNSSVNMSCSEAGESSSFDPFNKENLNTEGKIEDGTVARCEVSNKSTPSQHYDSCEEWFTPEADKLSPVSDINNVFIHEETSCVTENQNVNEVKVTVENQFENENQVSSKTQPQDACIMDGKHALHRTSENDFVLPPRTHYSLEMSLSEDNSRYLSNLENQQPVHQVQKHPSKQSTDRILKDIANVALEVQSTESNSKFCLKNNFDSSNTLENLVEFATYGTETYQDELKKIQQGLDSLCRGLNPKPISIESQNTEYRILEDEAEASHIQGDAVYSSTSDEHLKVSFEESNEKNIHLPAKRKSNILGEALPEIDFTKEARVPIGNNTILILSQSSSMKTNPHMTSSTQSPPASIQQIPLLDDQHSYENFNPPRSSETSPLTSEISSAPTSSLPMSLDLVKQKYLLRPNEMRSQGLQGFETNVISRLQREVSSRPKSLIRETYTEREQQAALRLTAAGRGYLVRRLLRTQRVQHIKATIQDTLKCALSLQSDPACIVSSSDLGLHTRLIQQLTAACYELYDTFFTLSTREKMIIIAQDRERQKNAKLVQLKILAKKTQPKTASEPRNNNIMGATKADKKNVTKVRRSKSVSSQDSASIKSNESVSSTRSYRVSRSQSNTQPVPNIRRRLVLI